MAGRKPDGYWKDYGNVVAEMSELVGGTVVDIPSEGERALYALGGLTHAMQMAFNPDYRSFVREFADLLERYEAKRDPDVDGFVEDFDRLLSTHKLGNLSDRETLLERTTDVATRVMRSYGSGFSAVRKLLGEEGGRE